jgi:hypothetical protein
MNDGANWLHPEEVDWSLVARAIFLSVGDGVWCYGTLPNILIWLGFWLCSPLGTILYLLGAVAGQLFAIALALPVSVIHSAYGMWAYGLTCYVIAGLLFVPSCRSVLIGIGSTCMHILLALYFNLVMNTWGLYGDGLAHSLTCLSFMGLKNLRTHLIPVDICEMTTAEDHYYQQALGNKLFFDLSTQLKECAIESKKAGSPTAASAPVVGAANVGPPQSGEADHNNADPTHVQVELQASLMHRLLVCTAAVSTLIVDSTWLLLSWGAFTNSELQPRKSTLDSMRRDRHEAHSLAPNWIIDQLEETFTSLQQLSTGTARSSFANASEQADFESSLLCLCFLSGMTEPDCDGLASFDKILSFINEHRLPQYGNSFSADAFVSSILQLRLQYAADSEVRALFKYFGISEGEGICIESLKSLMVKCRPEDTAMPAELDRMFGLLDEEQTGTVSFEENAHYFSHTCNISITNAIWTRVERYLEHKRRGQPSMLSI